MTRLYTFEESLDATQFLNCNPASPYKTFFRQVESGLYEPYRVKRSTVFGYFVTLDTAQTWLDSSRVNGDVGLEILARSDVYMDYGRTEQFIAFYEYWEFV